MFHCGNISVFDYRYGSIPPGWYCRTYNTSTNPTDPEFPKASYPKRLGQGIAVYWIEPVLSKDTEGHSGTGS